MATTVVHCKRARYDVYIGRPSEFGNPYSIGKDGSREQVIVDYLAYIMANSELLEKARGLKGKTLGCWCKPQACHGDVLAMLADES